MNYVGRIAAVFGLKLGEKFEIECDGVNLGRTFRFNCRGGDSCIEVLDKRTGLWFFTYENVLYKLISGEYKTIKTGKTYYGRLFRRMNHE